MRVYAGNEQREKRPTLLLYTVPSTIDASRPFICYDAFASVVCILDLSLVSCYKSSGEPNIERNLTAEERLLAQQSSCNVARNCSERGSYRIAAGTAAATWRRAARLA